MSIKFFFLNSFLKVGSGRSSDGASESLHAFPAARRRPLLPHVHHIQRRRSLRGGLSSSSPVQPPAARPGGVSRHPQGGAVQRPRHRHTLRQRARLPHHPGGVPQVRGRSRIPKHLRRGGGTRFLGGQRRPPENARQAERGGKLNTLQGLLYYKCIGVSRATGLCDLKTTTTSSSNQASWGEG